MIYDYCEFDSAEELVSFLNELKEDNVLFEIVSIQYKHFTGEFVCILFGELDGLFDD